MIGIDYVRTLVSIDLSHGCEYLINFRNDSNKKPSYTNWLRSTTHKQNYLYLIIRIKERL